jgi:methylenetetrahydrofolate dehydrogenase (NADP+)/methenyltetrahydrofolate cyclohydrolase
MARILSGTEVAESMNRTMAETAGTLRARGVRPTLAVIRMGARADDLAYERGAAKRCEAVGIAVKSLALPADAGRAALLEVIRAVNEDAGIHGALLLRPLPPHIREDEARAALSPAKDVDGITDASLAGLFSGGGAGFAPCTAEACMEILSYYGVKTAGRRAVVVGRSLVVGRPVAMLLLRADATVTVCHTKTENLPAAVREGDIVVAAAGAAGCLGAACFGPGQIVLDVGVHVGEDGVMRGDVDFDAAAPVVAAITPVPGGVGAVTSCVLARHVLKAADGFL